MSNRITVMRYEREKNIKTSLNQEQHHLVRQPEYLFNVLIQHVGQIVELIMIHLDFNSQEKVIWLFDKI